MKLFILILILLISSFLAGYGQIKQDTTWYAIKTDSSETYRPVQAIRHFEPYTIRRAGLYFDGTRSVVDYFIDPKNKKRLTVKIVDKFEL